MKQKRRIIYMGDDLWFLVEKYAQQHNMSRSESLRQLLIGGKK